MEPKQLDVDLVFRLDTQDKWDERFCWSYDGGKTWRSSSNWTSFPEMVKTQVNRYIVDKVLVPKLKPEGDLCCVCRNIGKIGVMRFSRITSGREAQAQVIYPSDGGEPYVDDVYYGCSYRIDRCERCGNEESDYA